MERQGPHPGWYYEPQGRQDVRRYWDGQRWTDQYQRVEQPMPVPAQQPAPRYYSLRVVAAIYLVLAWLVVIFGAVGVIVGAASASGLDVAAVLVGGVIYVAFLALTLFAFAAVIRLLLSVDENTRATTAAVVVMRNAQIA